MKIKSFIYLDDHKMYSYSSQLFEGISQYILCESEGAQIGDNIQKGDVSDGEFIANMMFRRNAQKEMRYLHDFAFDLFEKELIRRKLLYDVTKDTTIESLREKSFIRIKGKIIFEDFNRLRYIIENFNEIGRAMGELLGICNLEHNRDAQYTKNREEKNKQQIAANNAKKHTQQLLIENGLNLDERMVKNISKIFEIGYQNNYDIRFVVKEADLLYTAIINQAFLQESEQNLIFKYSRKSEKEFTLIGTISQSGLEKVELPVQSGNSMRDYSLNVIDKLSNLENVFVGRADNECIIDPIAIFTEV